MNKLQILLLLVTKLNSYELIRLIEVFFEGIDEIELWEKILRDERAYEMIERLLPKEPELQKQLNRKWKF